MGLGFQPWNFQAMSHNFVDFPVVKASFSGISTGIVTNLKILVFFYVYVQAPLLLRFFLEYPVKVSGSSLKAFLEQQYLKAFKLSHNDKIQGLIKKLNKQKKKFYTPSLFCPLCTESLIFSFLKSLQNGQQITNKEKCHA